MSPLRTRVWLSILLVAGTMVIPFGACAQHPERAPVIADSPLDELGWFVGGTWTAEEKSGDGSPLIVRLSCRWADTKTAILFHVSFVAGGKQVPHYDGMFVWHPGKRKLLLWQVNRKGEVAEGELTVEGKEINQVVHVSHPDGKEHFLKAHYERLSNDAFRFKAYFRVSETAEWQDALDIVYKRQPSTRRPK